MPPGKFFFIMQNAANWAIFIIFVRPFGGGHGPPGPPPLEPPVTCGMTREVKAEEDELKGRGKIEEEGDEQ